MNHKRAKMLKCVAYAALIQMGADPDDSTFSKFHKFSYRKLKKEWSSGRFQKETTKYNKINGI